MAKATRITHPTFAGAAIVDRDERERQDMQQDPERLGPKLETTDEGETVGHQRDHDQRAHQIAIDDRQPCTHFQRLGHDGRFEREENEGEGSVDQRSDRRAQITKARAACQQIDIDAMFGGVIADRKTSQKDKRADDENGRHGVAESISERDRAADRFKG
ncbi:hypothetical protein OIM99_27610 [Methylocella sp. CPCC 101449]|nr:hypothetical protein [Methylocella sp. CPCC 101449]MDT2024571.1 hypothetical protein [Methylocella sp. CPCC 101449]